MRLRIIPAVEQDARVVAFAQRPLGKALLLLLFGLMLSASGRTDAPQLTAVLAVLTAFPAHRRPLLVAATLYWLVRTAGFDWALVQRIAQQQGVAESLDLGRLQLVSIGGALLCCAGYYALARALAARGAMRHPVLSLLVVYLAAACVASYAPLDGGTRTMLWALLIVFGQYLWFLGYSLLDLSARQTPAFALQLGHYLPFWGGSATPFPKGAAALRKIEARDGRALALCQLKGCKLLAWALVLSAVSATWELFAYGRGGVLADIVEARLGWLPTLALPQVGAAMDALAAGHPFGGALSWASLLADFISKLLALSVWGHVIVATCRMAGFAALRNTYRPLAARSIADFWNRYYYYFKELLVDFFFYPAFLRFFRTHPRLRRAFATLAAAGFGNALYHYLRDAEVLVERGPWGALLAFRSYLVYGLLLGGAVALSQLRAARAQAGTAGTAGTAATAATSATSSPTASWRDELSRALAPVTICLFFCLLGVFDDPTRTRSLGSQCSFVLSLLGWNPTP